jgi:membrane protease YdiL (CAAX protease family)
MGQSTILALWLAAVLAFFAPALVERLRSLLKRRPAWIWAAPPLLTTAFAGAALLAGAFSAPLMLLVLTYTAAPVCCAFLQGPGPAPRPTALDFLAILLLWLPIEFNAAAKFVPLAARGFLHGVAYGIAMVLGLTLFAGFRSFPGLKLNLPRWNRDLWLPLAGFAMVAPVLAIVGMALGFIPPPHLPVQTAGRMAAAAGLIFIGTALPEEILFRSLIQNLLMQRFGGGVRTLLAAGLIFGCAHLDNGPQPLPNWRYMILASLAGLAYGKVFQKASTVLSAAGLHMLVDSTKHFFF